MSPIEQQARSAAGGCSNGQTEMSVLVDAAAIAAFARESVPRKIHARGVLACGSGKRSGRTAGISSVRGGGRDHGPR